MQTFKSSELILNQDNSIYHLGLLPEDIATTIITVGDPKRVRRISQFFDSIEVEKEKREFLTHTGYIGNKRLTVLSTGMGTDNIDIAFNELDALANIDFDSRQVKKEHKALQFIRIGTSGAIREDIPVGSMLISDFAMGLEGLMLFYDYQASSSEKKLLDNIKTFLESKQFSFPITPSIQQAGPKLLQAFQDEQWLHGITTTATGFYAPQNRLLRASSKVAEMFNILEEFQFQRLNFTNLEMETAGIYGLANLLGHQALSINLILANRRTGEFAHNPQELELQCIEQSLEKITSLL